MVVKVAGNKIAVICDGDKHQGIDRIEEDLKYQSALERMGWNLLELEGQILS